MRVIDVSKLTMPQQMILSGRTITNHWLKDGTMPSKDEMKIRGHIINEQIAKTIIYDVQVNNDKPLLITEEYLMMNHMKVLMEYTEFLKQHYPESWKQLKQKGSKAIAIGKSERARRKYMEQVQVRDAILLTQLLNEQND